MLYLWGIYVEPSFGFRRALTQVYGLGKFRADLIAKYLGIKPVTLCTSLGPLHQAKLHHAMKTVFWKTNNSLRQQKFEGLASLKEIRSYRGIRHGQFLPARGQRTHANAKTVKNRKSKV